LYILSTLTEKSQYVIRHEYYYILYSLRSETINCSCK